MTIYSYLDIGNVIIMFQYNFNFLWMGTLHEFTKTIYDRQDVTRSQFLSRVKLILFQSFPSP